MRARVRSIVILAAAAILAGTPLRRVSAQVDQVISFDGPFGSGAVRVVSHPDGDLIAISARSVFRSVDDGRTWVETTEGPDPPLRGLDAPFYSDYTIDGHVRYDYSPDESVSIAGETVHGELVPLDVFERTIPTDRVHVRLYPNPTAGQIRIDLATAKTGDAVLELFDVLGRRVRRIDVGFLPAGQHERNGSVVDLSSGTYYATLEIDGAVIARTEIVVVK